MKRQIALLLFVCALVVIGAGTAVLVGARVHAGSGQVYSIAEIRAGLAQDPQVWLGRTVRVQGAIIGFSFVGGCRPTWCGAVGYKLLSGTSVMRLVDGPPDPLLTSLRRLPLVGSLMPTPQSAHSGPAVYRVRLEVAPAGSCSGTICYEGALVDAAPPRIIGVHIFGTVQ